MFQNFLDPKTQRPYSAFHANPPHQRSRRSFAPSSGSRIHQGQNSQAQSQFSFLVQEIGCQCGCTFRVFERQKIFLEKTGRKTSAKNSSFRERCKACSRHSQRNTNVELGSVRSALELGWNRYSQLPATGGSSVDEISTRLSLPGKAVHSTLQRLLSLQLVSKHGETWRREAKGLETSDDVKNLSIQNFHRSLLEKAESSLTQVPVSERDFSAMLLPANPEKLKRLKVLIRKFQDQVEDLIQDGEESEVFALSIQCFPITRRKR